MKRSLLAATVAAIAPHGAEASDLAVGVGIVEAVAPTPEHLGVYSCVAVSLVVPAARVTFVPTIGVEWSPELGAWGFSSGLVMDVPVAKWLGVDVIASLVHDQAGAAWSEATFYAGIGAGVSMFHGAWALSPSLSAFHGINVNSWTLAPGLSVSRGF
jgi:hypothetical protein